MTATYTVERRMRRTGGLDPMDFDDGVVPGQIVLHILHLRDLGVEQIVDRQVDLVILGGGRL